MLEIVDVVHRYVCGMDEKTRYCCGHVSRMNFWSCILKKERLCHHIGKGGVYGYRRSQQSGTLRGRVMLKDPSQEVLQSTGPFCIAPDRGRSSRAPPVPAQTRSKVKDLKCFEKSSNTL